MSQYKWTEDGRFPLFILLVGLFLPLGLVEVGNMAEGRRGMIDSMIDSLTSSLSSSSSSGSSSSGSSQTVTPQQLYKIVKGCCSGAGGTYSPSAQDCVGVQSNWNAFTSCVGKGKVKYPNGNIHSYSGSEFVR